MSSARKLSPSPSKGSGSGDANSISDNEILDRYYEDVTEAIQGWNLFQIMSRWGFSNPN
jgi:hypothetical protein